MNDGKNNIRAMYAFADEIDRREGLAAYWAYHRLMREIAALYDYPFERVVAVFCALSPNCDYFQNLRSLITVLKGHREKVSPERVMVATYGHCKMRAFSYLNGVEYLQATRGKKIRSFYLNIINPDDPHPVTIDGHMVNVWYKTQYTMKEVVRLKFSYDRIADGFRWVADELNIRVNQLQSTLWFAQKRKFAINYSAQLDLLNGGDHWRIYHSPASIKPYPYKTPERYAPVSLFTPQTGRLYKEQ